MREIGDRGGESELGCESAWCVSISTALGRLEVGLPAEVRSTSGSAYAIGGRS